MERVRLLLRKTNQFVGQLLRVLGLWLERYRNDTLAASIVVSQALITFATVLAINCDSEATQKNSEMLLNHVSINFLQLEAKLENILDKKNLPTAHIDSTIHLLYPYEDIAADSLGNLLHLLWKGFEEKRLNAIQYSQRSSKINYSIMLFAIGMLSLAFTYFFSKRKIHSIFFVTGVGFHVWGIYILFKVFS
ncbi:MAG: hypothetical protein DKINENOH_05387 [bacterium]|nr:hypothetical protein [bacterium]